MHPHNVEGLLAIFALFVLPSAAICTRLVVGSIVKLRGPQAPPPSPDAARLEARVDALEDEMRQLGDTLDRVLTTVEFDAQLRSGAAGHSSMQLPPA